MRHQTSVIVAALAICGAFSYAQSGSDEGDPPAEPVTATARAPGFGASDPIPAVDTTSSTPNERARFAAALHQYKGGHWSAAYGRFMALADEGHPRAALIALQMLKHGPALYDSAWSAAPSQVASWERTVGGSAAIQLVAAGE
jgi:hypothetical protein